MRRLLMLIGVVSIVACGSAPELEPEQAAELISGTKHFPADYGYTIFLDDPEHMDRLRGSDLERGGLLTVVPVGQSKRPSDHFITLTEPGKAYVMADPLPAGQVRVRVATAYLQPGAASISSLRRLDDGSVEVSYRIHYRDVTPFASLLGRKLPDFETAKAHFRFENGKWNIAEAH